MNRKPVGDRPAPISCAMWAMHGYAICTALEVGSVRETDGHSLGMVVNHVKIIGFLI